MKDKVVGWIWTLTLISSISVVSPSQAAQTGFGVLSELDVIPGPGRVEIHVRLNLPMRYNGHTPQTSGDLLEIRLQPVSTAALQLEALGQRQSIPWKSSIDIPLEDIVYEGHFPSSPALLLKFSRSVEFEVKGGKDFRSIIVTIPAEASGRDVASPTSAPAIAESKSAQPTATESPETVAGPTMPSTARSTERAAPVAPAATSLPEARRSTTPSRAVPTDPYVINLASFSSPVDLTKVPRLDPFEGRTLYTTRATVDGKLWHRLRLGFFPDVASAKKLIESLEKSYPQAWVARASRDERAQHAGTAAAAVAAPAAAPLTRAPAKSTPPSQPPAPAATAARALSEDKLAGLMDEARIAMTAGDYPRAIQLYTKILLTPDSESAQEAQELLGLARERNGQLAHAKAEYQTYLQRYPEGEGADRVRQRLAGLLTATAVPKEKLRTTRREESQATWDVFGSFSQFYRRDELDNDTAGSLTTQSTLFSDLTVTARRRSTEYDIQARFTGGYDADFLDFSDSEDRVSEMYVDGLDRKRQISARLGRQTRSSGGVLGRFDGGLFGYGFSPTIWGNVVVGYPVRSTADTNVQTDAHFYGASFDLGTFADHWNYVVYVIEQERDDFTDRRAVGGEVRYFDPRRSFFSLVDYDLHFEELNIALGVGTWTFETGTTVNVNLDYRKSPVLTLFNAIQGQGVESLDELRGRFSEGELKQLALDRTADATTATLGVTHPFNPKFQVSGDVTTTKLSSTKASRGVEANPGTDYEFLYSVQLTGSALLKPGDIGILGLRYADLDTSDVYTLSLNSRYPVTSAFRINPRFDVILRDNKRDNSERQTLRPFLRLEYQWKRHMRFESELGADFIEDDTPLGSESTTTYFINVGYRIDF